MGDRHLAPRKDPSSPVVFTGSLTRLGSGPLRKLRSNVKKLLPRDKLLGEVQGKGLPVDEVRADRYNILVSERTYALVARGQGVPSGTWCGRCRCSTEALRAPFARSSRSCRLRQRSITWLSSTGLIGRSMSTVSQWTSRRAMLLLPCWWVLSPPPPHEVRVSLDSTCRMLQVGVTCAMFGVAPPQAAVLELLREIMRDIEQAPLDWPVQWAIFCREFRLPGVSREFLPDVALPPPLQYFAGKRCKCPSFAGQPGWMPFGRPCAATWRTLTRRCRAGALTQGPPPVLSWEPSTNSASTAWRPSETASNGGTSG